MSNSVILLQTVRA